MDFQDSLASWKTSAGNFAAVTACARTDVCVLGTFAAISAAMIHARAQPLYPPVGVAHSAGRQPLPPASRRRFVNIIALAPAAALRDVLLKATLATWLTCQLNTTFEAGSKS